MNESVSLLSKLGSIIVHVEEMQSDKGHSYDKVALDGLLKDPEVLAWMEKMRSMALLPEKR